MSESQPTLALTNSEDSCDLSASIEGMHAIADKMEAAQAAPEIAQNEDANRGSLDVSDGMILPNTFGLGALPNIMARTPIFGMKRRCMKDENGDIITCFYKNEVLASWKNTTVTFTGEQLGQKDLSALLGVLVLASKLPTGSRKVIASLRQINNAAGYEGGGVAPLKESLIRLSASTIRVESNKLDYSGSILDYELNKTTKKVTITLNDKQEEMWKEVTFIDMDIRKKLTTNLAKWLQIYVCTHKAVVGKPAILSIKKIQLLYGDNSTSKAETDELKKAAIAKFTCKLKKAATELEEHCVIISFSTRSSVFIYDRTEREVS